MLGEVFEENIVGLVIQIYLLSTPHELFWVKLHHPVGQSLDLGYEVSLSVLNSLFGVIGARVLEVDDLNEQDEELLEVLADHLLAVQHYFCVALVALHFVHFLDVHLVSFHQESLSNLGTSLCLQDVLCSTASSAVSELFTPESLEDLIVDRG